MALLELKDLHTFFRTKKGIVKAVNGVSYSVEAGRTLGVVGESGSGKSVSAMSILQLLDGNGYIDSGEILFEGRDLTKLTEKEMYSVRGNDISVIFQEPMTSLNPVFTVSRQHMCKVLEEIREEGRMEDKMETANNLYKMGMPLEQIAQAVQVSVQMIQEWLSGETSPVK